MYYKILILFYFFFHFILLKKILIIFLVVLIYFKFEILWDELTLREKKSIKNISYYKFL